MNKKIFLTSIIALGFACPAMAEPTYTGEFPSGGLMQADYTYTNAATESNMAGVYEGTVYANAQYVDIDYTIPAGKYMPANSEEIIDCNVSGSFCPGLPGTVNYTGAAQGLTSCSDATSGAYTLSAGTGSTADSCYRLCSGNVTIEHATGVTGYDYYGNGVDTCAPTGCDHGYHADSNACVANIITITWSDTDAEDITTNEAGTATYGSDIHTPVKAQHKNGKQFTGWLFSKTAPSNN